LLEPFKTALSNGFPFSHFAQQLVAVFFRKKKAMPPNLGREDPTFFTPEPVGYAHVDLVKCF
jgi:hypothetical protein